MADSPRLQALRAMVETLPRKGPFATPEMRAEIKDARVEYIRPSEADLKRSKCRHCGGTGKYWTMRGLEHCIGHQGSSGCFGGRSLAGKDREEWMRREATASLEQAREHWKKLAAIEPKTQGDARALIRAMEIAERSGRSARAEFDRLHADLESTKKKKRLLR